MNNKRRDKKGRVLQTGEYQESNGLYTYKYTDAFGVRKKLTSWTLTEADDTPTGKKAKLPLRKQIEQIQHDSYFGYNPQKITVADLVKKYIESNAKIKETTRENYLSILKRISREKIGLLTISSIRISLAKNILRDMYENGTPYSIMIMIHMLLKASFKMAIEDDMLVKNPFDFSLSKVIDGEIHSRDTLSIEEEKLFLEFIKSDNRFSKYYDAIYVLLHTGLRISEFCGLTVSDIDFQNNVINVDKQLQYIGTPKKLVIQSTKSKSGTRYIPMDTETAKAMKRIVDKRRAPRKEPKVDGVSGFLFFANGSGKPCNKDHWEVRFRAIVNKYNKTHDTPIPNITPHVCRHTYCSRLTTSGMNLKVIQYVMGHSNISITMNKYSHIGLEDLKNFFQECSA